MTQLVWFRNDLRVEDNPALSTAMRAGPTAACFVLSPAQWREHDVGDNRLSFLLRCLQSLQAELTALNVPLTVLNAERFADVPETLGRFVARNKIDALYLNHEYPWNEARRDRAVMGEMDGLGVAVHGFHGSVVHPPGTVLTEKGAPYGVFTPFKRRWLGLLTESAAKPIAKPRRQPQAPQVAEKALPKKIDGVSDAVLADLWPGGTAEARKRLRAFCRGPVMDYNAQRDLPAEPGTSSLSPYLSIGAIGPRTCLQAIGASETHRANGLEEGPATWLSELIWREFYRHVTAQFPHVSRGLPFKRDTDCIPWRDAPDEFAAWCEGHTGYPLVDAGMRQLVQTGWMHNRVRMVTAMFLSKHLLIDWRQGEAFFMQHLVDGDFAANNGGWQWSASTGTDAAPYFRIFNPESQAKKCDRSGVYIRSYVPELADAEVQGGAGSLTPGYPQPIVEHRLARERALAAFKGG
ncbi:MAG: FAD-binding domain-containing protein [Pseudomonadota bacterium]